MYIPGGSTCIISHDAESVEGEIYNYAVNMRVIVRKRPSDIKGGGGLRSNVKIAFAWASFVMA